MAVTGGTVGSGITAVAGGTSAGCVVTAAEVTDGGTVQTGSVCDAVEVSVDDAAEAEAVVVVVLPDAVVLVAESEVVVSTGRTSSGSF